MEEKITFNKLEAQNIRKLLNKKTESSSADQKTIRSKLREKGFSIENFTKSKKGFTAGDFDKLVEDGLIKISNDKKEQLCMVFLNVGYMDFYQGVKNDKISGGGKHVDINGWGGEIFNFKTFKGYNYGYAQIGGDINISKLGASKNADKIENVIVIWVATKPNERGAFIIGWYKNATIYKSVQNPPINSNRIWKGNKIEYYVKAKADDCTLVNKDKRIFSIPRGNGGFGQRNIWYASENQIIRKQVIDYIFKEKIPPFIQPIPKGGSPRQTDVLKRIEIEKKAIEEVSKYYSSLGYNVTSFEKDCVGWDLTATLGNRELKLEVKGLSGNSVLVELTPNEYLKLKEHRVSYRICIVTSALDTPKLRVFSYSDEIEKWICDDGLTLSVKEVLSAQFYV